MKDASCEVAHCLEDAIVGLMRHIVRVPLLLLITASIASGCQPDTGNEVVNDGNANAVSSLPRLPVVEPPMDRAALLKAVADAASAAALGRDDATEQRSLDGKRFEVRIRFGCAPAAPTPAAADKAKPARKVDSSEKKPFMVRFNDEDRTLRISAAPDLSLDDPSVAAFAGEEVEAVEGFWMRRPWLLADGCPVPPKPPETKEAPAKDTEKPAKKTDAKPDTAELADEGQRVGLAQFFTSADPRTSRRDSRAYETTKVLKEDQQLSRAGYNLVLSGRLRQLRGDGVIACRVEELNAAPECIVSAEFDRVWIEDPATRKMIAEWGN